MRVAETQPPKLSLATWSVCISQKLRSEAEQGTKPSTGIQETGIPSRGLSAATTGCFHFYLFFFLNIYLFPQEKKKKLLFFSISCYYESDGIKISL